ncbi:DUF262 domain-containing protein [uncultured Agrobacterium sp.]|uniref:DUF262 domain-containing protein n=1 Tax=uncultured Agrobacterium sp. TaxID=157277 RepID=UPI0025F684EB|nr:DUF262 domain-containing protein [uncultured Agrobacterium sp.]
MGYWNSSPHPISDLRDWQKAGRLQVRPDFQRREVWSPAAKIMLIDTILREVPMPKMFLWNEVIGESTHRSVIDGQQRILAILGFLDDGFTLEEPYDGPYLGLRFSELPQPEREKILRYRIDFNEAVGLNDAEVREVYSRVNKYSLPLNKQELRKADFPGAFLDICSELSSDDYLDEAKIFSLAQRRRMGDVEYVSELVAGMLEGPQDKKGDLDYFYTKYAIMNEDQATAIRDEFQSVLSDIKLIFDEKTLSLKGTRFHQKADFYTLFLSILELKRLNCVLGDKNLSPLRQDLRLLDKYIEPSSEIELLSEYAIKCVSQANSVSSRSWRKNFLMNIVSGTYRAKLPSQQALNEFHSILSDLPDDGVANLFDDCAICSKPLRDHPDDERVLCWPEGTDVFQMSNSQWASPSCEAAQKG